MAQSPDTFADKHPDSDRPATIDWAGDLVSENIATSTWAYVGDDIALDLHDLSISGTKTTVWLGGGTVGKQYKITNTITTDSVPPKTLAATKLLNIRDDAR